MTDTRTRVLLVDDHALIRTGNALVIEATDDLEVAGEAGSGEEAVTLAASLRPDVVLMDVRMPGMGGIEATRQITTTHPETRVIVLTTFDLDEYAYGSLRAGASAFLIKSATPGAHRRDPHGRSRRQRARPTHHPETDRDVRRSRRPTTREHETRSACCAVTARTRRIRLRRGRTHQRRDRGTALPHRADREDPCQPHPGQAPRPRPRTPRHHRLREPHSKPFQVAQHRGHFSPFSSKWTQATTS